MGGGLQQRSGAGKGRGGGVSHSRAPCARVQMPFPPCPSPSSRHVHTSPTRITHAGPFTTLCILLHPALAGMGEGEGKEKGPLSWLFPTRPQRDCSTNAPTGAEEAGSHEFLITRPKTDSWQSGFSEGRLFGNQQGREGNESWQKWAGRRRVIEKSPTYLNDTGAIRVFAHIAVYFRHDMNDFPGN